MEMSFADYVNNITRKEPGVKPVETLPRHLFALYLAGYLSGLDTEKMRTFIAARAYVASVTLPLVAENIAVEKGEQFRTLWAEKIDPKDAVQRLYSKDEIQVQLLELIEKDMPNGI